MNGQIRIYYLDYELSDTKKHHYYGRVLLSHALTDVCQMTFSEEMLGYTQKRKPYFKALPFFFNISHCRHTVVCAFSDHPVGIDIEASRTIRESLMRRALSRDELAYVTSSPLGREERFLELWTLKESYGKMTGEGLTDSLPCNAFILSEKPNKETDGDRAKKDEEGIFLLTREADEIKTNNPGFYLQWKRRGTADRTEPEVLSLCTDRISPVMFCPVSLQEG